VRSSSKPMAHNSRLDPAAGGPRCAGVTFVTDIPGENFPLTGTTNPVAAVMRQHQTLPERGIQYAFAGLRGYLVLTGLDFNLKAHRQNHLIFTGRIIATLRRARIG